MPGRAPKPAFGRDRGLQARMLLTACLLGLVYMVLIAVLIAAGVGVIAVAVIAGGLFLVQYFSAGRIALAAIGAQEVSPGQAPELHGIVQRLCRLADIPMPRIAVAPTELPNAFVVGRSPANSTMCVTGGLLALLGPDELEAVVGHELTHIANHDVMLMTIAGFFAAIASFIVRLGFWFHGALGGGDNDDEGRGSFAVGVLAGVVYVVSYLLIQALSRYRELAADRGAAIITGRPSALASALVKISGETDRIPPRDLRAVPGELTAFFIVAPELKASVPGRFATHPPLDARLRTLARLESQLQGVPA